MLKDLLAQLKDNNKKLIEIQNEITDLIANNNELIQSLDKAVSTPNRSMQSTKTPQAHHSSSNGTKLKTIKQLWEENDKDCLIIRKAKGWTPDFCFVVKAFDGDKATGISYICTKNEGAKVHRDPYLCTSKAAAFRLLNSDEAWMQQAIFPDLRISNPNHMIVRPGCFVTILDKDSEKQFEYQLLPSYDTYRYTTMGYRKKDNVEINQSSDADGVRTISESSALGQVLLGKTENDDVSVNVEDGFKHYKIISIKEAKLNR